MLRDLPPYASSSDSKRFLFHPSLLWLHSGICLVADESLKSDPKIAVAIESLNDSFVGTLQTGAMNTIWSDGFERICNTDENIEDVLHEIQDSLNEELHAEL